MHLFSFHSFCCITIFERYLSISHLRRFRREHTSVFTTSFCYSYFLCSFPFLSRKLYIHERERETTLFGRIADEGGLGVEILYSGARPKLGRRSVGATVAGELRVRPNTRCPGRCAPSPSIRIAVQKKRELLNIAVQSGRGIQFVAINPVGRY